MRTLKTSFRHHRRTQSRSPKHKTQSPPGPLKVKVLMPRPIIEEEPRRARPERRSREEKQQLAQLPDPAPVEASASAQDDAGVNAVDETTAAADSSAAQPSSDVREEPAPSLDQSRRARWCYRDEDRFDRP